MNAILVQRELTQVPVGKRMGRVLPYAVATAIVLCIYCYPALRIKALVHSDRLPAMCAPDLPLYLSLGSLQQSGPGKLLNPYYHVEVPENSAGFLKFRLGPVLYASLTRLLFGQMWVSLFVWNAIWWALTCLTALWLFDRFLPRGSTLLVITGLSMLMFFNFGMAREEITGWLHFPSPGIFGTIGLPYIRSFSPQVVMPVLFLYLGLQVLALQRRNAWWAWAGMAALQLFAFAVFPYTTPLMAGITAVAVAGMFLSGKRDLDWRSIVLYGIACALVDTIFLLHGAPVFSTHSSSVSVFHYEWVFLKAQMGKLWLFLGLLTILTACSRTIVPEVRWTLVGLGLTDMLMLLGDAFIPGPPFFITGHASYFEHAILVLLLIFLAPVAIARLGPDPRKVHVILGIALGFCLLNGIVLAESGVRRMLPFNREQADYVQWFAQGATGPQDLVIAQHDACGWVPFLSSAQTLYCRNAQAMLTADQNRNLQRSGEAWYLYFMGKDSNWVNRVSEDPAEVHRLETYGMYGEISSYVGAQLARQVTATRAELLPRLQQIEHHGSEASAFTRQFQQVWIVDNSHTPVFQRSNLEQYFEIHSQATAGDLVILGATPK